MTRHIFWATTESDPDQTRHLESFAYSVVYCVCWSRTIAQARHLYGHLANIAASKN